MMTDTPPDWVLREAAKKCGWGLRHIEQLRGIIASSVTFHALCDMILKHEQPPVDRKLLCAREAWDRWLSDKGHTDQIALAVLAITLWEEGFGK